MRLALYYVPEPGSVLAEMGRQLFGYDIETGEPVKSSPWPGTGRARRYGFHATLKAPFRLAPGATKDEFIAQAAQVASRHRPVSLTLRLGGLGDFRALRPLDPTPSLRALADDAVVTLDTLRAPLTKHEIARRETGRLSSVERELFLNWGYPYVFDRYRFHLTLCDDADEATQARFIEALLAAFPFVEADVPVTLADLCVVEEAGDGSFFRVIARLPLE